MKNILLLIGSPKKTGGVSAYFSRIIQKMLPTCQCATQMLRTKADIEKAVSQLPHTDAIILFAPLYVDGIPSHVLRFLKAAQAHCSQSPRACTLYVFSNCGFIEGRHNHAALLQYECFCERSGIAWGGGIGLGGGVMLHALYYVLLVRSLLFLLSMLLNLFSGDYIVNSALLWSFGRSILSFLYFNGGMLFASIKMAHAVRKGLFMGTLYMRALLPTFLFLPIADLFMALSALVRGKLLFSLYKRE